MSGDDAHAAEDGEALLDPRLEVEQQPLLLAQVLVLGEEPHRLKHGLDGLLDEPEIALRPSTVARRHDGSVTRSGNESATRSLDTLLPWSASRTTSRL